jgi:integrase
MLSRKSAPVGGSTPVNTTINGAAAKDDFKTRIDVKQLASSAAALDEYKISMQRQGLKESTIESRDKCLRTIAKQVNILNPDSVKALLVEQQWDENTKCKRVEDLKAFYAHRKIQWTAPRYRRTEKLPFIPTEAEIDQLIDGIERLGRCGSKTAAFLQTIKETAARPGEIWALQWTDVDFERGAVRIAAEKRSNPRERKIPPKLIAKLSSLPRSSTYVFRNPARNRIKSLDDFRDRFTKQRRRVAEEVGNPRLLKTSFRTLRHFKATMEYHRTKDILHVMQVLGHKNIRNTLVYTHLVDFENDEYVCKVAKTVQEASALVESGFDYVTDVDGLKLFRKRK